MPKKSQINEYSDWYASNSNQMSTRVELNSANDGGTEPVILLLEAERKILEGW